MARSLMADQTPPPDGVPTLVTAIVSILSTLGIAKGIGPAARWIGKRLDVMHQAGVRERGDFLTRTIAELQAAREEMVELRRDLAEERELRMAIAMENAVLTERVDRLQEQRNEDKRECEAAIRALRREITVLQRKQAGGTP